MKLEDQIIEAVLAELQRQSDASGAVAVGAASEGVVAVNGRINLDELAMAIAGALAGGP